MRELRRFLVPHGAVVEFSARPKRGQFQRAEVWHALPVVTIRHPKFATLRLTAKWGRFVLSAITTEGQWLELRP